VAYTLALVPWPSAPTKQARRAVGAATTLGLIGAVGVVIGLAALLWQLLPLAAVTFVGCSLLSLVAYSMSTMVSRPPHVVEYSPLSWRRFSSGCNQPHSGTGSARLICLPRPKGVDNRFQKTLEDANLRLASVVSDVMGQSARDMVAAFGSTSG
jgi:hypothetical protein